MNMGWRERFTLVCGPGLLTGVTFGDWLRVYRENGFRVSPRRVLNAASSFLGSFGNSFFRRIENWRFDKPVGETSIQPPLFILGHWRNGTTHLHNLFAADQRFAYPNIYQVMYPHTFLTTEAIKSRLLAPLMPETRFGVDNVRMSWAVPYEDEFAIAMASGLSPYLGLAFGHRREHYDRYLTLRSVSADEVERWKQTLLHFLRKLSWKYGRPLVLKSPTHTCRIRLLLEMFPDAKFVHIHRHPFAVFRSTRKMIRGVHAYNGLQAAIDWDDHIVNRYCEMYDAFLEEKDLIPAGHFHELAFEDLDRDPIGQMGRIYKSLTLPDFSVCEPDLQAYVNSISGYKKNEFAELAVDVKSLLADRWQRYFEAWGYDPDVTGMA
jgi:hypothetical protein